MIITIVTIIICTLFLIGSMNAATNAIIKGINDLREELAIYNKWKPKG